MVSPSISLPTARICVAQVWGRRQPGVRQKENEEGEKQISCLIAMLKYLIDLFNNEVNVSQCANEYYQCENTIVSYECVCTDGTESFNGACVRNRLRFSEV